MKAWCINLDRRPDRLAYITAEFARAGLPFERIAAVDAQDPAVAAAAARVPPTAAGPRMSAGAYGCFQSHREFWRRLVASGDSWGMVFEDDVVLADGIGAYLADGWVPPDADLVKLETYNRRIHVATGPSLAAGPRRLAHLRSFNKGTGCYVISGPLAARLLAATETFAEPIDDYLFNAEVSPVVSGLVTYQMIPAPVVQGDRTLGAARPDWARTSIVQRSEGQDGTGGSRRKTRLQHYLFRLGQEMHALRNRTRYIALPHG